METDSGLTYSKWWEALNKNKQNNDIQNSNVNWKQKYNNA